MPDLFEIMGWDEEETSPADELEAGQRRKTNVGPATIIRVCETEVHLRADAHPSLTLVTTLERAAEYPLIESGDEAR